MRSLSTVSRTLLLLYYKEKFTMMSYGSWCVRRPRNISGFQETYPRVRRLAHEMLHASYTNQPSTVGSSHFACTVPRAPRVPRPPPPPLSLPAPPTPRSPPPLPPSSRRAPPRRPSPLGGRPLRSPAPPPPPPSFLSPPPPPSFLSPPPPPPRRDPLPPLRLPALPAVPPAVGSLKSSAISSATVPSPASDDATNPN